MQTIFAFHKIEQFSGKINYRPSIKASLVTSTSNPLHYKND